MGGGAVRKPEVIIDGVKYVPANDAVANSLDMAKALLLSCEGKCTDEQAKDILDSGHVTVLVNDWGKGEPLQTFIDNLAEVKGDE